MLKAKRHWQRSMYEASEAGNMHALEHIKEFQDNYADMVGRDMVPDYARIGAQAKNARNQLSSGRAGHHFSEEQSSDRRITWVPSWSREIPSCCWRRAGAISMPRDSPWIGTTGAFPPESFC